MFRLLPYRKSRRDGSVYVAVLSVALMVAVVGISSLHLARIETREAVVLDEMARARLAARSGIECALAKIRSDLLWRTTYTSGVASLVSNLASSLFGDDSFEYSVTDTDGDLDDNPEDSATLRCVGVAGDSRCAIQVTLQPGGEGLSCLDASMHVHDDLVNQYILRTNQVVSSNENIYTTQSGASIQGNAQAVGVVVGTVSGTRTNGMNPALDMPDSTSVFDYYISNGTPISRSQIPNGKIEKALLSAGNNPYGSHVTNPQGIYVINCQGQRVSIIDSRIHATLVFINATTPVELEKSLLWQPTIANFPAMLVQGHLLMKWEQQQNLVESAQGVNFNPSHTPVNGVSDNDTQDSYPSKITGLVYVSGNLEFDKQASIDGVVVVGGYMRNVGTVNLLYKSIYATDAPPGFSSGTDMEILPGSWKQVAY